MSRLAAGASAEEITAAYEHHFGRVLDARAWRQLEQVLMERRLLVPQDVEALDAHFAPAPARPRNRNTLLSGTVPLINPGRLIEWLLGRAPWLVGRAMGAVTVLLLLALGAYVVAASADVFEGARRTWESPSVGLLLVGVALLASTTTHEFGHGLVCVAHGGRCEEMGLAWRIPMVFAYARADDIFLLPAPHRTRIALAGMLAGVIPLVPFLIAHPLLPSGTLRDATSMVLVAGLFACLMNLIPFLGLDGQKMLSHRLGVWDISAEGRHLVLHQWRRLRTGGGVPARRFSPWVWGYAVSELALMTLAGIGGSWWWWQRLAGPIGPWGAALVVLAAWGLTLSVVTLVRRILRGRGDA